MRQEPKIDKGEARKMREAGMTYREIGKVFGATRQAVHAALGRDPGAKPYPHLVKAWEKEAILDYWRRGKRISWIARRVGRSWNAVAKVVRSDVS